MAIVINFDTDKKTVLRVYNDLSLNSLNKDEIETVIDSLLNFATASETQKNSRRAEKRERKSIQSRIQNEQTIEDIRQALQSKKMTLEDLQNQVKGEEETYRDLKITVVHADTDLFSPQQERWLDCMEQNGEMSAALMIATELSTEKEKITYEQGLIALRELVTRAMLKEKGTI